MLIGLVERVFDGADPNVLLNSFFAFDAGFSGGVYVAAGNLRGGATDFVIDEIQNELCKDVVIRN